MEKSQGADPKGGVPIGEGERRVSDSRELPAAKELVSVGQVSVVLEAPLLRQVVAGGGGGQAFSVGPVLDGVGEAVVHLEAEDAAMAMAASADQDDEEEENDDRDDVVSAVQTNHRLVLFWVWRSRDDGVSHARTVIGIGS